MTRKYINQNSDFDFNRLSDSKFNKKLLIIASISILASCSTTKEMAKESLIESISDSRTGTQAFVRKYDTEPYGINAGGIIKARKDAKKKKAKDILENY